MGIEIDFLPVGEESSGGDAIAVRYGNLHGSRDEQVVMVVDGGYKDCGEALVEHITTHYGTDYVDIVVSTHPDQDHSSGLTVVLEELGVGELWMHQPWRHSAEMASLRVQHFESSKLSDWVEKSLRSVSDLESLANSKGIPIIEPFVGTQTSDGIVRVIGPSIPYYVELQTEVAKSGTLGHQAWSVLTKAAEAVRNLVAETLTEESLTDSGTTSPRNNSSAILLFSIEDRHYLLTADAGIPALTYAAGELDALGIAAGELRFIQVPHHGSRHNVGPSILDRLLGPKGQESTHSTAFISAPKKNPDKKHPHKKVSNAFIRRGYAVHATQGSGKWHHQNAPERDGWSSATPMQFYDQVEDDDES